MSFTSKPPLKNETIEAVCDLIDANLDSVEGFKDVAAALQDHSVEMHLRGLAVERKELAIELKSHVASAEKRSAIRGNWLAAFRQCWASVRRESRGMSPSAALREVKRGEEFIRIAYRNALKQVADNALNDVLQRQYAIVRSAGDKIDKLRLQSGSR